MANTRDEFGFARIAMNACPQSKYILVNRTAEKKHGSDFMNLLLIVLVLAECD